MKGIIGLGIFSILIFFSSCSYFVYRPHSAKQKYFARPKVQFMMAVVNFREARGHWPASLAELALYSRENAQIIENFQYHSVDFKVKSVDNLVVDFYDYKKEPYIPDNDKIDLNAFSGRIKFYKSREKFVWKVKMR